MHFSHPDARHLVPDAVDLPSALARTTHMAVGAHPDDLEILAHHGIQACHGQPDAWFLGVVVTDGAGSPRSGRYGACTDAELQVLRWVEQQEAARIGEYGACVQLSHPSATLKACAPGPVADLAALLAAARPSILYTHNLLDSHDTHVAVTLAVLAAVRSLPLDQRPARVLGCEVWRDLDWLTEADKVALDMGTEEDLQAALLGVFKSQIAGGKRYDLATLGRRRAHATYQASHTVDGAQGLTFAMDLSPLATDDSLDPAAFALAAIDRFRTEAAERIQRLRCLT